SHAAAIRRATNFLAQPLERRRLLTGDFAFANGIGGPFNDVAQDVATDSSGNVYATGLFSGTTPIDFDPGSGTANLATTASTRGLFIAKYSSSGSFAWVKGILCPSFNAIGGSLPGAIKVDGSGNV